MSAEDQSAASGLRAFATAKGLTFQESGRVRAATHALAAAGAGGERPVVGGELREGMDGRLFSVPAGDATGGFTAVLTEVPETRPYAVTIACQRRDGPAGREPVKYGKERWEEVRIESASFEREFRLLVLEGQDTGWTYELFSPALISWLTDRAPAGLGFELNEGWLCVLQPGELEGGAELDGLCDAAAELASRFREEALEEADDPDLLRFAANTKRMDEALASVEWDRPPASVAEAIAAYRRNASWRPTVLLGAVVGAVVGMVVAAAGGYLLGGPFGLIAGVVAGLAGGFKVMREIGTERYRFEGSISSSWAGINAFNREYARSRGLDRVKIARFHHDNRDLPVAGEADSVQVGPVPGTDLTGAYAMISDSPELRAHGADSMSAADGRPLSADALVVELPGVDPAAVERLDLPDGYRAAAFGGHKVVVWHPIAGNMTRTLAGCDEFRERAGAIIARLANPT